MLALAAEDPPSEEEERGAEQVSLLFDLAAAGIC